MSTMEENYAKLRDHIRYFKEDARRTQIKINESTYEKERLEYMEDHGRIKETIGCLIKMARRLRGYIQNNPVQEHSNAVGA